MTGGRVERRLAAVLAADVAGYSKLMGADEVGTLAALKALRRELIDPAFAEHKGRIVKTTGDGLLVEFASAVDAVTCAMAVQGSMAKRNGEAAEKITFRIGINVGDIIIDGDDIFGDGVNIAARVESECEPGGVYLSGSAFEQVRGKTNFAFDHLGERSLKNIDRPVQLYAARPVGSARSASTARTEPPKPLALPDKPSIAVLPFQNMSGDPEQEYFADGMVEDIITALSRFKSMFVIARNSSFTYKGKAVDIKQVGRDLGVRYVLEGSVRKSGAKVRITGQLIDAGTGAHLWADKFDGDLNNIFELQDEITSNVVNAILPTLQQSEYEKSRRKPTENLTAYDYYLRGLAKMYQFKKETLEDALPLFQNAIDLDPEFASPLAAAAFWYAVRRTFGFGWSADSGEAAKQSLSLARRALELDKDDATVLTYAGYMPAFWDDNIEESFDLLQRAVQANPNLALAWNYLGWVNVYLGDHPAAIEAFRRALRLNPRDPVVFTTQTGLAFSYFFIEQIDEATKWAESALRGNPDFLGGHRAMLVCRVSLGDIEGARSAWENLQRADPTQRIGNIRLRFPLRRPADLAKLAHCYRFAGMPE